MEKKRKKIIAICQLLAIGGFVIIALASSSAKDINSQEFRDGFEKGWEQGTEIGRSLRGDALPEAEYLDIDSINYLPDVAQNN